jgi:hypothetical protein
MENSEEVVERVLAGLRDSDAPAGMERRILEAMQDHASAQSRSGWRWLGPMAAIRPVAFGLALAGMVALVLTIPAVHRRGHAPTQSKKNPAPLASQPSAPSAVLSESAQLPTEPSARSIVKVSARKARFVRADDSVALREMHAPSRPEPPLPLTEQERLLLRIARKRNPEELAALDPVMRATRYAKEKAEFEKFFGRSTTGDNE